MKATTPAIGVRPLPRSLSGWIGRHRALLAVTVIWGLFVANFNPLAITDGDAQRHLALVQRLFGEPVHASGHHFGVAFLYAPFYGLGKLVAAAGIPTLGGAAIEHVLVSLGSAVYVLVASALVLALLDRLDLPAAGIVVIAVLFGTSLFYYGAFVTGRTHPGEAAIFAAALVVLLGYVRSAFARPDLVVLLGIILGFATTVRYLSVAAAITLAVGLAVIRRYRHAAILLVASAGTFLALFLVFASRGTNPLDPGRSTVEAGGFVAFDPLAPLKMLVTDHRGLFVWSPVVILALLGYLHLVRSRPNDRAFLILAAAMGGAVLPLYTFVSFWDGTYSFSNRFLTFLFPLVAIGLGGLFERAQAAARALSLVAVAWSLFLAFNLETIGVPGWDWEMRDVGASDVALQVVREDVTFGEYTYGLHHRSRLKLPVPVKDW